MTIESVQFFSSCFLLALAATAMQLTRRLAKLPKLTD